VLILALDTCDARGSVALLRDSQVLGVARHNTDEDYSAWLLPEVKRVLRSAGVALGDIELFCAAAGPGSFTGLRVGLTTVKALSEAYGRSVVGMSRLEAVASFAGGDQPWVAAFIDAHRGQVFGALFRRSAEGLRLVSQEVVEQPEEFLAWVDGVTASESVAWASLDPEILTALRSWRLGKPNRGEILRVEPELATRIGQLGLKKAERGEVTDALRLDANYVRRSDAEIFWKGTGPHAK
jgi:tRNA threonylcarbamoyladenosine biosynthesis protein TsaB